MHADPLQPRKQSRRVITGLSTLFKPATLRWGTLRVVLLTFAALGVLGALLWAPLVLDSVAEAHPLLHHLLPPGDMPRVYAALAVAVPLLLIAALQVSAARRLPTSLANRHIGAGEGAAMARAGAAVRGALVLVTVAQLLIALNIGAFAVLLVCAGLAGVGSVAFLVAFVTIPEMLIAHGVGGLWEGLATIWDYASLMRHFFAAELHLLDGTYVEPIVGAVVVFTLYYLAPAVLAVWALRHAPAPGEVVEGR